LQKIITTRDIVFNKLKHYLELYKDIALLEVVQEIVQVIAIRDNLDKARGVQELDILETELCTDYSNTKILP
jgi:hypothetical protein